MVDLLLDDLHAGEPNLQNLPRGYPQIKRFFVPDAGRIFCYFDYSQVELRIAAHLSNDPVMLRGFNEGRDLHAATAKRIFGSEITKEQRQVGKQINFATIYDVSSTQITDEERAVIAAWVAAGAPAN